VIDGPFAETKELIAGFWMWKVKSMEEAVAWVKRCPNPMNEESEIEIRQVFEADDFGEAFTPELREQEASIRAQTLGLGALRFENRPELHLAGLNETYTKETRAKIPAQWERFGTFCGMPVQIGTNTYGVSHDYQGDEGKFDYLTGFEVSAGATLPAEFDMLHIPARRYAIFTYRGPISSIAAAFDKIFSQWAPDCGLKLAHGPCLERYTVEFDPATSAGTEIWIPLEG
jgi:predicted transcriptional regulator YdeE